MQARSWRRAVLEQRPWAVPLALATVAALTLLGRKSFWQDESYSFVAAHRDTGDLLRLIAQDETNMSPYYLALHVWLELGRSEGFLRLLSVPPFLGAVVVVVALVRRLFDLPTAVVTGVLLAVSPMGVHFAQEARAYSLVLLCASASVLLLVQFVARPRRRVGVAWVLVSALGTYAHYFTSLVVLAALLSLALRPDLRTQLRRLAPAVVALGVLVTPIALFIPRRGTGPLTTAAPAGLAQPAGLLRWLGGEWLPLVALLALLAGAGLLACVRDLRKGRTGPAAWRSGLVLLWLLLPPSLVLLASLVQPLWSARYFLLCLPPFLVLVARGLLGLRRPVRVPVAVLLAPALLVALLLYYAEPVKWGSDWRSASAHVQAQLRPGDAVWFLPGTSHVPFAYYSWQRSLPQVPDVSIAPDGLRGRIHPAQLPRRTVHERVRAAPRVWVVVRTLTYSRGGEARNARAERRISSALGDARVVERRQHGPRLEVRLYERPSP